MTPKEKRLRINCEKACVELVKETLHDIDGFERTIGLLQSHIISAVCSFAAAGLTMEQGESIMQDIAEHGIDVYRQQFDAAQAWAKQQGKMQ